MIGVAASSSATEIYRNMTKKNKKKSKRNGAKQDASRGGALAELSV